MNTQISPVRCQLETGLRLNELGVWTIFNSPTQLPDTARSGSAANRFQQLSGLFLPTQRAVNLSLRKRRGMFYQWRLCDATATTSTAQPGVALTSGRKTRRQKNGCSTDTHPESRQEGVKAMRLAPRKVGDIDQIQNPGANQGKLSLSPRKALFLNKI